MKDNETKKATIVTNGNIPKTMSEFEISYLTPEMGAEYLINNYGEDEIYAKVRYWYKLYETDYRGELFLRGIIYAAKKLISTDKKKKIELVIRECTKRIRKEKYWILKPQNLWTVVSTISGYLLGVGSGYLLYLLTHK